MPWVVWLTCMAYICCDHKDFESWYTFDGIHRSYLGVVGMQGCVLHLSGEAACVDG